MVRALAFKNNILEMTNQNLPSVLDTFPTELGGVYARKGFAYQDHVAARFYIKMLSNLSLSEVCCETHDDILLIWNDDEDQVAEFVQVKSEHPDQLWTVAQLYDQNSLLDKSLARDQSAERSWFRTVTCRQIHSDLEVLTRCRGHQDRSLCYAPFERLANQVQSKLGNTTSRNGNDTLYWLTNACWDVIGENEIEILNRSALADFLHPFAPSDPDTVRHIYANLLNLAKTSAELGAEMRERKSISYSGLMDKVHEWLFPSSQERGTQRLESKLANAGLDSVCVEVAKEQRRFYLMNKRTATYLNVDKAKGIESEVLFTLHALRSSLDSGEFDEKGVLFHDRCLKKVAGLSSATRHKNIVLPEGYLSGCMYEITNRCRHRFVRLKP